MKYTFTFDRQDEKKFREILSRLDEGDFTIIEDFKPIYTKSIQESMIILDMDPESALTLRLGMKKLHIQRERTKEELAKEKERDERNTIKVYIDTGDNA